MTENFLQIDAFNDNNETDKKGNAIRLTITTPYGCFTAYMSPAEYDNATKAGFFIRDGEGKDGAGCINTTQMFFTQSFSL